MKKFKKLLSVLLAVVLMLSTMSVMSFAVKGDADPAKFGANYYDSIDDPSTALMTDDQRATIIMDIVDDLLYSAYLVNMTIPILNIPVDLTSYDGLVKTLNGNVTGLLGAAGDIGSLQYSTIRGKATSRAKDGDAASLMYLLAFAGENKDLIYDILNKGSLDLGTVGSLAKIDLSAVNNLLADIPGMLGSAIYGLTTHSLPIGDDEAYPNSPAWENSSKPNFDEMVQGLIEKLFFEPRWTINITDRSQNTLGDQAVEEIKEDGTKNYYCYGVDKDGNLITEDNGNEKIYLQYWAPDSQLVPAAQEEFVRSLLFKDGKLNVNGDNLVTLVESVLEWAYDSYGAPNLDGQFRATLMQFCGAVNNGLSNSEEDMAIKAQLKQMMDDMRALGMDGEIENPTKLSDAFAAKDGAAGNKNFMYFTLDGSPITKDSTNLYYIVEWYGWYEYYKVDLTNVKGFFNLGKWEYQTPTWDELTAGHTAGGAYLAEANNIVGNMLNSVLTGINWENGATESARVEKNLANLVKAFIKSDPAGIFGNDFAKDFDPASLDSMDFEDLFVMVGKEIIPDLMKSLVIPETVTSAEELIVYAVREFTAEILPEYGKGWDDKIDAAAKLTGEAKEDEFLNIALNMGMTIANYYLKNVIALGTTHNNTTGETGVEAVPMGPDYTWQAMLNYDIDWVLAYWLPTLSSYVVSQHPEAFGAGKTDPLAKASAIFSSVFPTVAKSFGCASDSYAIDASVLYSKLRSILNGDFVPALQALQRKGSGTVAYQTVYGAVVTLVVDLFGGLGFKSSGSFPTLTNHINAALASQTAPLTTLIGAYGAKTPIATIAKGLLGCLGDTRAIWAQDAIRIIASFLGSYTSLMSFDGMSADGQTAYTSGTQFTVDTKVTFNVSGVRDAFNTVAFRSGTTVQDGVYTARLTSARILDNNLNEVPGSAKTLSDTLQPNGSATVSLSLNSVPTTTELYAVEIKYIVTTPTGLDLEEATLTRQIVVTQKQNDAVTEKTSTWNGNLTYRASWNKDGSSPSKINFKFKNMYISEKEALDKAANLQLGMNPASGSKLKDAKYYINGYGYNRTDANGKITIHDKDDDTSALTNLDGKLDIYQNGTKINAQNAWFKWNLNSNVDGSLTNAGETKYQNLWVVEPGTGRGDYKDDFTEFKINANLEILAWAWNDFTVGWGESYKNTLSHTVTPYIILYNSYNLEGILGDILAQGRVKADYDTTSAEGSAAWNAYVNAVKNANELLYGEWIAAGFVTASKNPDGSSKFKTYGEDLQKAAAEVDKYRKSAEELAGNYIDPSDPKSPINFVYNKVQEEHDKNLSNQDYVMYRWLEYYWTVQSLNDFINASTRPAQRDAYGSLTGVSGDKIADVLAAVTDANLKKVIEDKLVVAPSDEENEAAHKAYDKFKAPKYDIAMLKNDIATIDKNDDEIDKGETYARLLPKYASVPYHYLERAINDFGNETADGYTSQSWAKYTETLAKAKEVLADAKAGTALPSDIHSARYFFLCAYTRLVKTEDAADYTAFNEVYKKAQEILADYANAQVVNGVTKDEAFAQLLEAAGYAVTLNEGTDDQEKFIIGGDFTGVSAKNQEGTLNIGSQYWVDGITENIEAALANFKTAEPEIKPIEGGTGVVDSTNMYLYGITPGADVSTVFEGVEGELVYVKNDKGVTNGTGAKVELWTTGKTELKATYTVIVFGDIDGDAIIDFTDYSAMKAMMQGVKYNAASTIAADVEDATDINNSTVDFSDYSAMKNALQGVKLPTNPYPEA